MSDISWRLNDVVADAAIGDAEPSLQRGDEIELTYRFKPRPQSNRGGAQFGAAQFGGHRGQFSGVIHHEARYERAVDYIDYSGPVSTGRDINGIPWFRERVPDEARVDTFLVEFVPSEHLQKQGFDDFWAVVTGGEENTEFRGAQARLSLTVFVLGLSTDYPTESAVRTAFEDSL